MAWTLVYANDSAGTVTAGDIDTLIRAVSNGASVKIVLSSTSVYPPLSGEYIYSFVPHTVHVRNGIVFATNTQDVSVSFVADDLKFIEDSYYYMIIASTKGTLEQIRWKVGEHTQVGHDQSTWLMRWFVE